jgi:hypothetical protein
VANALLMVVCFVIYVFRYFGFVAFVVGCSFPAQMCSCKQRVADLFRSCSLAKTVLTYLQLLCVRCLS